MLLMRRCLLFRGCLLFKGYYLKGAYCLRGAYCLGGLLLEGVYWFKEAVVLVVIVRCCLFMPEVM